MKKITLLMAGVITASLIFTGCRDDGISATNLMGYIGKNSIAPIIIDDKNYTEPNKTGEVTDFSLDIFRELYEGENTLISPFSIVNALSMTANGARNETLLQMEDTLKVDVDSLREYLYAYRSYLPSENKYRVNIANSIWFKDEESFTVDQEFLQTNKDYYDAEVYKASFDESTLKDINSWVKQDTDGQIKKVLDKIPEDAVMYLINALSFEAQWENIYKDSAIHEGEFVTEDLDRTNVDFMYSEEERYIALENGEGFSKPYADNKYSFVALLPDAGVSMEEFISSLKGKALVEAVNNPISCAVEAAIPKFEFEYDKELSEGLKALGIEDAFDDATADFTGLGQSTEGNIYINRVIHKTKITVDEKGTKAGAVTAVEMITESARMDEVKRITLNRPFFFMIVDNEFGMPIFMGTLNEIT